jgi:hypothetical protein|tara:strand:+ start:1888 stop:2025 length:138 start_codon:yes stop_codon:yes gene_type:complete
VFVKNVKKERGLVMPNVGGVEFPYTPEGVKKASRARKKYRKKKGK